MEVCWVCSILKLKLVRVISSMRSCVVVVLKEGYIFRMFIWGYVIGFEDN